MSTKYTNKPIIGLVVLFIVTMTACTGTSQTVKGNPKAILGAVLGSTAGGLIGAAAGGRSAGIAAGVLLGGLLGGTVGNVLDQRDNELAAKTAHRAFEHARTGQTSTWRNPDSGHSGTLTPVGTFQRANGEYCREYQQTVTIQGQKQESFGRACRQPDGAWKIQS